MERSVIIGIICSTIAIVLLVAGIILTMLAGYRRRLKEQMLYAQKELDYEKELRQAGNEISEQLLERLSRDLHDNIGHSLTCIRIHIENRKLENPDLKPVLDPLDEYMDSASNQLRAMSRSMNSEFISNVGLEGSVALEVQRVHDLHRQHIHYLPPANTVRSLSENQELMVYRIFQEILHNAIRHSEAGNIYVVLSDEEGFQLTVSDDGKGFDLETTLHSSKANGLRNIISRSKLAGLQCKITTNPDKGCTYALSLENIPSYG